MPTIEFNGKIYNDIAEMPATERQAYEQLMSIFKDENQDGIPDVFQGDVVSNLIKVATTEFIVNGERVSGLGNMSAEQRAKLQKGLYKLQDLGILSQVPDLPELEQGTDWEDAAIRPSKPIILPSSAIQEDTDSRRMLIITALISILLCVVGFAAILMMSG